MMLTHQERKLPGQHAVQDDAAGPHINRRAIVCRPIAPLSQQQQLGRRVGRCAHSRCLGHGVQDRRLGVAKVGDLEGGLEVAAVQQDVVHAQISVEDVLGAHKHHKSVRVMR